MKLENVNSSDLAYVAQRNGHKSETGGMIGSKIKQDGNIPSRRHILGSKIFKEQLLEIFGKKNIFFSKNLFLIFFSKKVFFKSHNAKKLKKRPFRLIQRFLQTENFKKMQGGTLW